MRDVGERVATAFPAPGSIQSVSVTGRAPLQQGGRRPQRPRQWMSLRRPGPAGPASHRATSSSPSPPAQGRPGDACEAAFRWRRAGTCRRKRPMAAGARSELEPPNIVTNTTLAWCFDETGVSCVRRHAKLRAERKTICGQPLPHGEGRGVTVTRVRGPRMEVWAPSDRVSGGRSRIRTPASEARQANFPSRVKRALSLVFPLVIIRLFAKRSPASLRPISMAMNVASSAVRGLGRLPEPRRARVRRAANGEGLRRRRKGRLRLESVHPS